MYPYSQLSTIQASFITAFLFEEFLLASFSKGSSAGHKFSQLSFV